MPETFRATTGLTRMRYKSIVCGQMKRFVLLDAVLSQRHQAGGKKGPPPRTGTASPQLEDLLRVTPKSQGQGCFPKLMSKVHLQATPPFSLAAPPFLKPT